MKLFADRSWNRSFRNSMGLSTKLLH